MTILGMFSLIFFIGFAIVGVAFFVAIEFARRKQGKPREMTLAQSDITGKNLARILSILFFISYGLSFLVITPGSYSKPPSYYLLISLCAGLVAADIIFANKKSSIVTNLAKSYLLALNVFLMNQIIFPYGIGGADSGSHLAGLINPIITNGHIPETAFTYMAFPVHHIFVAIGSLVLSEPSGFAYNFLGGLVISFGVLFAFLVGRFLFDDKCGLLSALLFSGSGFVIYWASHPAQITYVAPIVLALILTLLYLYQRGRFGFRILVPIFFVFIIFSHPYSSVLVLIMIVSILASEKLAIAERLSSLRERLSNWSVSTPVLIFLLVLLTHWIFYSFLFESAVGYGKWYVATIFGESLIAPQSVYDPLPLSMIFMNTFGLSLMGMMSAFGFFYFYSRLSLPRAIIIGLTVALATVAFIGLFFNFAYIIPHRIFFYLEALAFIFFAAGAARSLKLDTYRRNVSFPRNLALTLLVVLVFFFSASSTVAGFETSLFSNDQPHTKLYETGYERHSAIWMDEHLENQEGIYIYKAWSFSPHSIHLLSGQEENSNLIFENIPLTTIDYDINMELLENDSFILFSEYDISIGFQSGLTGSGRYGLGIYGRFDYGDLEDLGALSRYFDSGEVIIFHKKN